MAIVLPILTEENPVLRTKTEPVKSITPKISQLIQHMYYTLMLHNGWGIAAPQIGSNKSICIIRAPEEPPIIMINPNITKKSEQTRKLIEGCLSCPNKEIEVDRHTSIVVEHLDERGQHCIKYLKDTAARIAQHEIDHLNGILIVDSLH